MTKSYANLYKYRRYVMVSNTKQKSTALMHEGLWGTTLDNKNYVSVDKRGLDNLLWLSSTKKTTIMEFHFWTTNDFYIKNVLSSTNDVVTAVHSWGLSQYLPMAYRINWSYYFEIDESNLMQMLKKKLFKGIGVLWLPIDIFCVTFEGLAQW